MKTILQIYSDFQIIPNLQQHQLRVAAVAKQICESQQVPVHTEDAIRACLLHDMGNILKFDFNYFPEFFEPQGRKYWEDVRDHFAKKYGQNEHAATLAIAQEIGVSKNILNLIDAVGFTHIPPTLQDQNLEKKICCYADQRVGPFGVISISDRLAEGKKRYAGRKNLDNFDALAADLITLEQQVFTDSNLRPEQITDHSISSELQPLSHFSI